MDNLIRVGVTSDINIDGQSPTEKAFKPALMFLEGVFSESQIKKWILELEFLGTYKLVVPISDPHQATTHLEYTIDYNGLELLDESDFSCRINVPELLHCLKRGLLQAKDTEMGINNTTFMTSFINTAIKTYKMKEKGDT